MFSRGLLIGESMQNQHELCLVYPRFHSMWYDTLSTIHALFTLYPDLCNVFMAQLLPLPRHTIQPLGRWTRHRETAGYDTIEALVESTAINPS